jgi:hypothetical protein
MKGDKMGVIKGLGSLDPDLWKFYDEALDKTVEDRNNEAIDEMVKEILEKIVSKTDMHYEDFNYYDYTPIVKKYLPKLQQPIRWESHNFEVDIPYIQNS